MSPAIAQCARRYLGTRFHHQGRLKKNSGGKGGIDCLGLLVMVAAELDLRGRNGEKLSDFDARDYSHQPDARALRAKLESLLYPTTIIAPGNILLLNVDGSPQHLAIATDTGIIHAYAPARAVVEHALDDYWRGKIVAVYTTGCDTHPTGGESSPDRECHILQPVV